MPSALPQRAAAAPVAVTPMAFARAIVAGYRRWGLDPSEALQQAQITPAKLQQPDARISAHEMERLSAAAMQELDDEALGAFSRKLPWGSYGMLARASLSSPTLGVALKRWCRHHRLIAPEMSLRLQVVGASGVVTVEFDGLAAVDREFALVHVLRNLHGLACWYIDSRIPLQEARFPFPAPLHAAVYTLLFCSPVSFDAPAARIRFDARYLALPLRRDEGALRQMLQRPLPLTVLPYRRDRLLVQQVRQALAAQPAAAHSADGLAALLNVSARTLHRQLGEEGASLQQLKDEVRCERAKDLLYRSHQPLKQIAQAVGFRNEKSFSRAFRGWTQLSPGEFRAAGGPAG